MTNEDERRLQAIREMVPSEELPFGANFYDQKPFRDLIDSVGIDPQVGKVLMSYVAAKSGLPIIFGDRRTIDIPMRKIRGKVRKVFEERGKENGRTIEGEAEKGARLLEDLTRNSPHWFEYVKELKNPSLYTEDGSPREDIPEGVYMSRPTRALEFWSYWHPDHPVEFRRIRNLLEIDF